MQLDVAVLSQRGGRSENQDACGYWKGDGASFFVVCDGAGGHSGGAVAANVALSEALAHLRSRGECSAEAVESALRCANDAVVREQQAHSEHSQMRATIVVLALDPTRSTASWGHLGDSRLYCFRSQTIVTQTRDHSVVQSLVDAGYLPPEQLRSSPDRSKLLSALGDAEQFEPALLQEALAVAAGDQFLLCTDGLWEYVREDEMEQLLRESRSAEEWLRALERVVLERAKRRHDNYSAIAVWCNP